MVGEPFLRRFFSSRLTAAWLAPRQQHAVAHAWTGGLGGAKAGADQLCPGAQRNSRHYRDGNRSVVRIRSQNLS